jgi:molybdopterin-guanine dinucleotide biosynthesis protein MobB
MPPIASFIGKSKSGRTALIEKLISELKSRGYRVATVKHTPLQLALDKLDKDRWRHIQAGNEAAAIGSSDRTVVTKPTTHNVGLDDIVQIFGEDYDIILAEGFKQSSAHKIEVHRKEIGPPFGAARKLTAIATDEPPESKTRQFSLQDVKGLADVLENGFMQPQRQRISTYMNNRPVTPTTFPKAIISNTLVGTMSSLKGRGDIRSMEVS